MARDKRRLNVCFLTDEYPGETLTGGIGTYTYTMAHAIKDCVDKVFVVVATKKGGGLEEKDGISIYRIPLGSAEPARSPFIKIPARLFLAVRFYRAVSYLDKSFGVDVVQAPETRAPAFFISKGRSYRLITRLSAATALIHKANRERMGPLDWILFGIYKAVEKAQLNNSAVIIATTDFYRNFVNNWLGVGLNRIEVIPNGADLDYIAQRSSGENLTGITDYILYVGSFAPIKGVDILVDALQYILEKHPSQKTVFLGAKMGSAKIRDAVMGLKRKYGDRVIIMDWVSRDHVIPIIRDAKFIVLPSVLDNMPNVLLEAMALGKAVISTSSNGFDEVINNGFNGFLVPAKNITELSKAIETCLARSDLGQIGKNARKTIEEKFKIEKMAVQTCGVYRKMLKHT